MSLLSLPLWAGSREELQSGWQWESMWMPQHIWRGWPKLHISFPPFGPLNSCFSFPSCSWAIANERRHMGSNSGGNKMQNSHISQALWAVFYGPLKHWVGSLQLFPCVQGRIFADSLHSIGGGGPLFPRSSISGGISGCSKREKVEKSTRNW